MCVWHYATHLRRTATADGYKASRSVARLAGILDQSVARAVGMAVALIKIGVRMDVGNLIQLEVL